MPQNAASNALTGGVIASFFAAPPVWLGLAVLLAAAELVSPSTLLVSVLFPLPAALAAWQCRRWWAAALVVGMTAVSLADELSASETWGIGPPLVNAAARIVAFASFALTTAYAARLRDELADPYAITPKSGDPLPTAMRSPAAWAALALVLLVADCMTGPEVLVSVLFVLPVLLAGLHRRLGWAFGLSAVLVVGRLVLELMKGGSWLPWADLANAAFRFSMLGLAAYVADLAGYLHGEAAARNGDAEGHSVDTVIELAALDADTLTEGALTGPARRTRFGVLSEAVAAAGIGATLVWDVLASTVSRDRPAPPS